MGGRIPDTTATPRAWFALAMTHKVPMNVLGTMWRNTATDTEVATLEERPKFFRGGSQGLVHKRKPPGAEVLAGRRRQDSGGAAGLWYP